MLLPNSGLHNVPGVGVVIYPTTRFYKHIQTTAYQVVNGSYVQSALTKQQDETKVLHLKNLIK